MKNKEEIEEEARFLTCEGWKPFVDVMMDDYRFFRDNTASTN